MSHKDGISTDGEVGKERSKRRKQCKDGGGGGGARAGSGAAGVGRRVRAAAFSASAAGDHLKRSGRKGASFVVPFGKAGLGAARSKRGGTVHRAVPGNLLEGCGCCHGPGGDTTAPRAWAVGVAPERNPKRRHLSGVQSRGRGAALCRAEPFPGRTRPPHPSHLRVWRSF